MKRLRMMRLVGIASVLAAFGLAACGDDDGGNTTPDAGGSTIDAGSTADAKSADAATPTHAGTAGLHEIKLLDIPTLGNGVQFNISFQKTGVPVADGFSTGVAIPPCGATLTDVTVAAQNPNDLNEGVVTLAVKKMNGDPGWPFPPCKADTMGDYHCASAQGSAGKLEAGSNMVLKFTDTSATPTTFGALQVGATLVNATTGAVYPITGASGNSLGIFSGTGATVGTLAAWQVVSGTGLPVPLTSGVDGSSPGPTPDYFADTDTVKFTLATDTGSGAHFNYTSTGDIQVGDSFELDDATATLLGPGSKLNLDTTTPITFGCKTTGDHACSLTNAQGTIVVIDATDAVVSPTDVTGMGKATKYTASLTCAAFDTKVAVPAAAIAILKKANPKKLRISVFRDFFEPLTNSAAPRNTINVVAGHGQIKFQNL